MENNKNEGAKQNTKAKIDFTAIDSKFDLSSCTAKLVLNYIYDKTISLI